MSNYTGHDICNTYFQNSNQMTDFKHLPGLELHTQNTFGI